MEGDNIGAAGALGFLALFDQAEKPLQATTISHSNVNTPTEHTTPTIIVLRLRYTKNADKRTCNAGKKEKKLRKKKKRDVPFSSMYPS
jgi:hypothetical protein